MQNNTLSHVHSPSKRGGALCKLPDFRTLGTGARIYTYAHPGQPLLAECGVAQSSGMFHCPWALHACMGFPHKGAKYHCLGRACMGVRHARKSVRLKGAVDQSWKGPIPQQEHARLLTCGAAAGTMTRAYKKELLRLAPKAAGRPVLS